MRTSLTQVIALHLVIAVSHAAYARDLKVSPQQIEMLRITLAQVKAAEREAIAELPGMVVPPPNDRIAVPAPFAGTVLHLHVLPGQSVEKGQELATIASQSFIEAVSRLEQSQVELRAAEVTERRMRSLASDKAVALRQVEDAAAQLEKMRLTFEQNRRTANLGAIKQNEDGSYSLRAPKAGHVVETRVVPGAALESMAVAVVIDSSEKLWVQVQLPAALIGRIRVGDGIAVIGAGKGRVVSVGSDLDTITRSTLLYAELTEDAGLVPGQMVTITASRPSAQARLSVPTGAVAQVNGESIVFLRTEVGFVPQTVRILGRTGGETTIESDLAPGRLVAVSGLAQLEKMLGGE